jgi:hypothetical protein
MSYLLHQAVHNGDIDQITQLIQAGHDVNSKDHNGLRPLSLRRANATPFFYLPPSKFQEENTTLRIEQLLLKAGANPNLYHAMQCPPLILAIRLLKIDTIHLLLTHGADPNIEDSQGNRPIYHAISKLFLEQNNAPLLYLVNHPTIDLVKKNPYGITPFDWAIFSFIKVKLELNEYKVLNTKRKEDNERLMVSLIKMFLLKGVNLHQNSLYYPDTNPDQLEAIQHLKLSLLKAFELPFYRNIASTTLLNNENRCIYFMQSELYPFLQAEIAKTQARIAFAQSLYKLPKFSQLNAIMSACATPIQKMAFFNSPAYLTSEKKKLAGLCTSSQREYARQLHDFKITCILFLRKQDLLCLDVKLIIMTYLLDILNFSPLDVQALPLLHHNSHSL